MYEACGRDANKHEVKQNTLLASRLCAECFISCKARARQGFNYLRISREML